ncbi:hypothetical protein SAMN04487898_10491 [Pedobacter sp. ok626]|uniref:hypothetical protein n=1 Tax=Pedobacter sp. ok626 TaxID=1761882 RepID=UPI000883B42E|nr:hypothetical protein [Pedobacter sp. ok626]SDJ72135.1 hypothetical protein SAMN04487898_10491 [Pedobacter sp. ok626]
MKPYQLLLFVLLWGCNTPYYATVNNMGAQPATLTLTSGQVLNGKIQIRTFDSYSTISNVAFAEGVSKTYKTYYLNEIDFLFFNGSNYSVKNLKGNDMWGGNALRFIKELTPAGSKLQLFEHETISKGTDGKEVKETQLFVQLPGNTRDVYNAQSEKFIPNFDEKVAPYTTACIALTNKIKAKDKDFFYAFVNQGAVRRKQVWMNIVNEYNNCK